MEIYLHNTVTGKKEVFTPLSAASNSQSKVVTMYNCGPTVYNYAHIGNLRSYVFADTVRRVLEWNGYTVKQVMNITDIGHLSSDADDGDDKMTNALKREGKPLTLVAMREVADFYFEKFRNDLVALNIELPEKFPFASDHVAEDIALVERLTERGFTYTISDGVYFDTSKYPEYGMLGRSHKETKKESQIESQAAISSEEEHSRIGMNNEKKNQRDFALWKLSDKSVGKLDNKLGYESPFGRGFPGWHIECSAMSVKYLGPEFDIHTGGIDHIPVHHNNEIAQAVCAGYPFARVWMHNAFLNIKDDAGAEVKMAKSGENFITLQVLRDRGISPLAYRYFLLTARYSSPVDFSWESLEAADTAWKRLKKQVQALPEVEAEAKTNLDEASPILQEYKSKFTTFINDDLDTPKALALIWDILKIEDENFNSFGKQVLIQQFDRVLGLQLFEKEKSEVLFEIPEEIQQLITERETAREEKNWKLSDELREQIERLGYVIKDTKNGVEVKNLI